MQINTDNIKGFKLNSGVELLGEVLEETDSSFKLKKALFWQLVQVQEGKFDIQFYKHISLILHLINIIISQLRLCTLNYSIIKAYYLDRDWNTTTVF